MTELQRMGVSVLGSDISSSMLSIATSAQVAPGQNQVPCSTLRGFLSLADMGHGLPYREGVFDAVVGLSSVQWLAYDSPSQACASPKASID